MSNPQNLPIFIESASNLSNIKEKNMTPYGLKSPLIAPEIDDTIPSVLNLSSESLNPRIKPFPSFKKNSISIFGSNSLFISKILNGNSIINKTTIRRNDKKNAIIPRFRALSGENLNLKQKDNDSDEEEEDGDVYFFKSIDEEENKKIDNITSEIDDKELNQIEKNDDEDEDEDDEGYNILESLKKNKEKENF